MVVEDVGAGLEVGDGAGDFEDAVVGPRTHVHAFHGVAKFFQAGGVGLGVFVEQGRGHLGVAVDAGFVLEAALLEHAMTRWRMAALGSPGALLDIWSKSTGCTSICRSMRSSSGPEILLM